VNKTLKERVGYILNSNGICFHKIKCSECDKMYNKIIKLILDELPESRADKFNNYKDSYDEGFDAGVAETKKRIGG
jgi:hypothetical protein